MSKKEDPWVYFEGIKVPKKCTEKSYYVIFSKPVEIATKQGWIPISKTKGVVEADSMIEGWIMRWILEKNYDYPSGKTEVESAQAVVEVMRPVKEEAKMKKEYEGFVGDTSYELFDSVVTTVEVIKPSKEMLPSGVRDMKKEYEGFVGEIPEKGMRFKEVSFSLGEKVTVDYQSKNAQLGVVVSLGDVSVELGYQSAVNFVKDKLKERVKEIREEML